jgi:inositol oxygenase
MDGHAQDMQVRAVAKEWCPVCLSEDGSSTSDLRFVTLSCGHIICESCSSAAAKAGFESCPTCRRPHLLDTEMLGGRLNTYRTEYAAWRTGASAGSVGEVSDISQPMSPQRTRRSLGLHSSSAGDLAILGDTAPEDINAAGVLKKSQPSSSAIKVDRGTDRATNNPYAHPRFAIVGMGRAGKIHLNVLNARSDAEAFYLVDVNAESNLRAPGAKNTTDLTEVLADASVDCVIVSTPTPVHAEVIRASLEAGKHVFAEKPLCCDASEVTSLFELAETNGLLLYTAYNRRYDPAIKEAIAEVRSRKHGKVLGATLVSRDYPYPPAHYLATSGNIFKDCVIHDLDYLTWMLNEEPASLRASANAKPGERAGGMHEYSEVHLTFPSGATATLINARVSTSYDHQLSVYCEDGVVRVVNPTSDLGVTFADRFAKSYHAQIDAFIEGVRGVGRGEAAVPNISAQRTLYLDCLVDACHSSAVSGGKLIDLTGEASASAPPPAELRTYDESTAERVKALYAEMRRKQSVEHVQAMRAKYTAAGQLGSIKLTAWGALEHLKSFVDVSDPDVTLPNMIHAFQTAEGLRAAKMPDWLQLTGLIHDLGKMIHVRGCDADGTSMSTQWSIVGDTWVVGCQMPDELVFPEFNKESPDAIHPERTTELGIYKEGCGLDDVLCAFGHDEYMYEVLRQSPGVKLPREALYVVRYHSLYPWHDAGCYERLLSDYDRQMLGWVKLFNQHDLYTKANTYYSEEELVELRAYYAALVEKYLPGELHF